MVRCLYEILEVDRDADDAAIRLAYRKAALKWHPGGCGGSHALLASGTGPCQGPWSPCAQRARAVLCRQEPAPT